MLRNYLKAYAFLLVLLFGGKIKSQIIPTGTWQIINTEIAFDNKWSLFAEGQLRSQRVFKEYFFHELNGSVNYKPKRNISLLLGLGKNGTYSNGGNFKTPLLNHEFRIWEQVAFLNSVKRVRIEHRYRIEQRWRTAGYRNRFRIRLNVTIPINKPSLEKGTLYANFYDEVFLSNQKPQHYELNRFLVGLGYQISKPTRFTISWIRQFNYSPNNITVRKDFIQSTLSFRINPHFTHHNHHNVILN